MLLVKSNPFSSVRLSNPIGFIPSRRMMCSFVPNCPSVEKTSKLNLELFRELGVYSQTFIGANFDRILLEKNESGFVRVSVPLNSSIRSKFSEISSLRLNFWSPESGVKIDPESIHTHPAYFESLIVKGGYSHEIFEQAEPGDPNALHYDHYRMFKQIGLKSFAFLGDCRLAKGVRKVEKQGDIVAFPQDLIHRVLESSPKTLTLNVVWSGEEITNYDIFLTQNATPDNIKTKRNMVSPKQSKVLLGEIMEYLSCYTKS